MGAIVGIAVLVFIAWIFNRLASMFLERNGA